MSLKVKLGLSIYGKTLGKQYMQAALLLLLISYKQPVQVGRHSDDHHNT